jgi:hypothetical protein
MGSINHSNILPQAGVYCQIIPRPPFILKEPAKVRVGLKPICFPERLAEGRIRSGQKACKVAEAVRPVKRPREFNVHSVVDDIDAGLHGMAATP